MRLAARTIILLTLLLPIPGPAAAQDAGPSLSRLTSTLKVDDSVDVATLDGRHRAGRIVSLRPESVTIASGSQRFSIPSSQVARIVLKDRIHNGALIGLAIGAGPGVLGAWALGSLCSNEGASCGAGSVLLFALGAGAGAAIGAGADGLRHAVVYDIGGRVSSEYTPQLFGAAGFTRLAAGGGTGLRIPVDFSGGWGMTAANGAGFELQTSRSVLTASNRVDCVTTSSTLLAGALASTCLGSGTQTVDRLTTVSGKFVYTFGKSRVRPFASGGLAAYESRTMTPFVSRGFPTGTASVSQATRRQTGLAMVAGGGVKLALNIHITIRPEVSWMSDLQHRWNATSAKVGIAYYW